MGWVILLALIGLGIGGLRLLGVRGGGLTAGAAALLVGAAGYALQGSPNLRGAPARGTEAGDSFPLTQARHAFFGHFTPAESWLRGAASQPTVSSDGRWALYMSAETGRSEVYLTTYPSHEWRTQLSVAGGVSPRWRADGREAYYVARDNKLMAVTITVHGNRATLSEPNPLFDVRPVSRGMFYAPAADGERFLVNTLRDASAAASLTFVQDWSAALQP